MLDNPTLSRLPPHPAGAGASGEWSASEFACLLAAAVLAAAEAPAPKPPRAVARVANGVAAAASHVAGAVVVAGDGLEDHDGAAAHSPNHDTEATAGQVARGTDTRATGVAGAAREAARAFQWKHQVA